MRRAPLSTLFPYTTLFRSWVVAVPEDPTVRVAFTGRRQPGVAGDANLSLLVGEPDAVAARRASLAGLGMDLTQAVLDRKSTRLNSSHHVISYAVFSLNKKQ